MRWLRARISDRRGYKANRPPEPIRTADPTWLSPGHWQQLFCFVHIPKCAGTSFKNLLWNVYGRGFITYNKRMSKYDPRAMTAEEAKDILALSGHLSYGYHEMFGTQSTADGVFAHRHVMYVSIVRNPVDRILSLARFVRTFPGHPLYKATRNMTFEQFFDFVRVEAPGMIGNRQSSMLTAGRPEAAIEFVEKNYLAVSTLEGASEMIAKLAEQLDWPQVQIGHRNSSPKDMTEDADRDIVAKFCRENCKLDVALYEHLSKQPGSFVMNEGKTGEASASACHEMTRQIRL